MGRSFEHFVRDGLLAGHIVESLRLVFLPIFCARDDWWFDQPAARRFNAPDARVRAFLGIMRRVEGEGWWMRELGFDGYESSAPTASPEDLEAEHRRTPVGSWVWMQAARQTLCYCNPASDAHVLCLGPEYVQEAGLESAFVESLRSTIAGVNAIPDSRERRWHATFVRHHLSMGVRIQSVDAGRCLDELQA